MPAVVVAAKLVSQPGRRRSLVASLSALVPGVHGETECEPNGDRPCEIVEDSVLVIRESPSIGAFERGGEASAMVGHQTQLADVPDGPPQIVLVDPGPMRNAAKGRVQQ